MASTTAPDAPMKQSGLRRVVTASMAGTVVEWYEFFLFATAATLVFNLIMFPPSDDPYAAVIAAFLTYAVGFIARPLGGIVFGHFGDKYGRKRLLQLAIILVGVATFLMGCLPTFDQVGYWAPALLVLLRFAQGFAVGGEWGGAVLLVAEHSPNKTRGFWASVPAGGRPGRQPAGHDRAAHPQQRAEPGGVPRVGLARGVLAVRRHRRDRLLHPHQDHRCADLPRGAEAGRGGEARALRRDRGAQAIPARRLHRDGPALRGEHHVLPRRDVLDHLPAHRARDGCDGDPQLPRRSRTSCTCS